jgi:hypothetical protein
VKCTCALLFVLLLLVSVSASQNAAAQAPARTDVYHVFFAKAALGKGAEGGELLKKGIGSSMPGHYIVLRHQSGEDWDYAVIVHLGAKATVEAPGTAVPAGALDLIAWHNDTFVSGPAWPEFAKAMGMDDAANSSGSVYVVSVFRPAPGHYDELEKSLAQQPGGGQNVAGEVLMRHLEGGPWTFLTLTRYKSWQDFATGEKASVADTLKPDGGWLGVRNHSTYHNDTITDRIAP